MYSTGSLLFLILISSLCPVLIGKTFQEDLTLTTSQKSQLDKFKSLVESRLPHDWMKKEVFLLRWLRARNWNIEKADVYLMNHVKWMKENNIDGIHREDWSDLDSDVQYWLEGRDKESRPILYLSVQRYDLRKIALSGKQERFTRYIDKALDDACGLVRELGNKYKNVSQGILIVNLDSFNLVQHGCLRCKEAKAISPALLRAILNCIPLILRIPLAYEQHHPGCADKIILVNTPEIFQPLLQSIRGLLSRETNEALMIYGTNKKVWGAAMDEYFERDQLPPEIGGTKVYKGMETDY